MNIVFCVSPIGLGHATRAVAVGSELVRQGANVEFMTGGQANSLISSYGFNSQNIITGPNPTEKDGRMMYPGLWYIKYWRAYRRNKQVLSRLIPERRYDLVVGDEEFASISLAQELGLRHAMVSDELELGFAQSWFSRAIEERVEKWYKNLQSKTAMIIVPEEGEDQMNIRHTPPIVRRVTKTKEQLLSSLGISPAGTLITFSMSGSGLGYYFAERTARAFLKAGLVDARLVLSGIDSVSTKAHNIHPLGFVRDNHELVAYSDLVITSAGKSTIDEALSEGTPIIAIPFKNHVEQVRNAEALGFTFEDIDRLDVLIQQHVGRRTPPKKFQGAQIAAKLILESLALT